MHVEKDLNPYLPITQVPLKNLFYIMNHNYPIMAAFTISFVVYLRQLIL